MGETIGAVIGWLIIWLLTVPLVIMGTFDLFDVAWIVYAPCALIGIGLPAWGAVEALFPNVRNSRTEKIVGGVGAGAGLLFGIVVACTMVVLTVGYGIWTLGVLFLGIPAFALAKVLGFEVEPSMNWLVGGVVAAGVVSVVVLRKAIGDDRRKPK
jgi:hypothetical protein